MYCLGFPHCRQAKHIKDCQLCLLAVIARHVTWQLWLPVQPRYPGIDDGATLLKQAGAAGQRFVGALSSNSPQNRFLVLGSLAGGQSPNLMSPNADPVQLAISYSKGSSGQQQVLAVMPGESPSPGVLSVLVATVQC